MGALEEGGKALGTVAESMKSAPLVLAFLIVNFSFIAFAVYIMHEVGDTIRARNEQQTSLLKNIMDECITNRPRASIMYRSAKDRERAKVTLPPIPLPPLDLEAPKTAPP